MHPPNKNWTIKVEVHGMTFYITDIAFQDIAMAAEYGIQTKIPNVKTKLFWANSSNGEE